MSRQRWRRSRALSRRGVAGPLLAVPPPQLPARVPWIRMPARRWKRLTRARGPAATRLDARSCFGDRVVQDGHELVASVRADGDPVPLAAFKTANAHRVARPHGI